MTSRIKLFGLPIAALFALSACVDPSFQQGGERQRTGQGAIIGAALGGILGSRQGSDGNDKVRNAALGAAVGGALGAAVGSALDRQAAQLRNSMGSQVDVINTGSELIVRMPQDILFAVDSAEVSGSARQDLFALADNLRANPNSRVRIVGHTDNTGSAGYNQSLSERRAFSVRRVLVNAGVQPARVVAVGRGEDQPIATNGTPAGRAKNRRVDVRIIPNA